MNGRDAKAVRASGLEITRDDPALGARTRGSCGRGGPTTTRGTGTAGADGRPMKVRTTYLLIARYVSSRGRATAPGALAQQQRCANRAKYRSASMRRHGLAKIGERGAGVICCPRRPHLKQRGRAFGSWDRGPR